MVKTNTVQVITKSEGKIQIPILILRWGPCLLETLGLNMRWRPSRGTSLLHIQDSKSAEHLHKYEKRGLAYLLPDATTFCSSVSSSFWLKIKEEWKTFHICDIFGRKRTCGSNDVLGIYASVGRANSPFDSGLWEDSEGQHLQWNIGTRRKNGSLSTSIVNLFC